MQDVSVQQIDVGEEWITQHNGRRETEQPNADGSGEGNNSYNTRDYNLQIFVDNLICIKVKKTEIVSCDPYAGCWY